jgi:hypothetical protein
LPFAVSAGTAGLIAAGVGAVGSVAGGLISANASESAAQTQAGAAEQAAALQNAQFQQIQQNLAPYMAAGTNALPGLQAAIAGYGNAFSGYGAAAGVPQGAAYGGAVPGAAPAAAPGAPGAPGAGGQAGGGSPFVSVGASTGLTDPSQALAAAGFSMTTNPQTNQIQVTDAGGNVTMFPAGTAPTAIAGQLGLVGFNQGAAPGQPATPGAPGTAAPTGTAVAQGAPGGQSANPYAGFFQSPGYQFMFGQGQNAVQNAATNQGGPNSGNTLKALTTFGQGLANQNYQQYLGNYQQYLGNYQNYISNLSGVTGAGQNAAANLGGFGQTAATNAGNALIGAGNATAAGQIGSANALTGGINGIGQNALLYSLLQGGGGGQNYVDNGSF